MQPSIRMLVSVVKRYHNNQIDTAKVIKELFEIAREMKLEDSTAGKLGLTPEKSMLYTPFLLRIALPSF